MRASLHETFTPEQAFKVFRDARLTDNEIHEMIGRLTVIAPSALIEAVHNTKKDRTS